MATLSYDEFMSEFYPLMEYYEKTLKQGVVLLYYNDLREFSLDDLKEAFRQIRRKRVYASFPKIAEILEVLQGGSDEELLEVQTLKAKEQLRYAVQIRPKSGNSVYFSDKALMGTITSLGGWEHLGLISSDEFEKLLKFDFNKIYKSYAQNRNYKPPLYFVGRYERENRFNGTFSDDSAYVYIIGDNSLKELKLTHFLENKTQNRLNENKALNKLLESVKI